MSWSLHSKGLRNVGRGDFGTAGSMYKQILARDPSDWMAIMMFAHCCEQEGRLSEALALVEQGVRMHPGNLLALQAAIRLSVATDDHTRAETYVRSALALPEVRNEIPGDSATPRSALMIMHALRRLPGLRRRIRPEDIRPLELGPQTIELQAWKHWAEEYLAWREGMPGPSGSGVH